MGALLDHLAVVKDCNLVAEPAGGQSVADVDGGFVRCNLVEFCVNLGFGDGVQGCGGFIQNQEGSVLVEGAGDGDFLGLAARNLYPFRVKLLVQRRIQAVGQGVQPVAEGGFVQAVGGPGRVVLPCAGHILPQGEGQQLEILEHHREQSQVIPVVVFADVDAVQEDLAFGGVVEAAHQLDEGGFARTVLAHHRQPAAHLELHVDVAQGPLV